MNQAKRDTLNAMIKCIKNGQELSEEDKAYTIKAIQIFAFLEDFVLQDMTTEEYMAYMERSH